MQNRWGQERVATYNPKWKYKQRETPQKNVQSWKKKNDYSSECVGYPITWSVNIVKKHAGASNLHHEQTAMME